MMWGSGFLISPVLKEGHVSVTAYFPDARWYRYYDGAEVKKQTHLHIILNKHSLLNCKVDALTKLQKSTKHYDDELCTS